MKKRNTSMTYGLRKIAFLLCAVFILGVPYFSIGHAEDSAGYFDESGNWAAEEAASSEAVVIGDPAEESAQPVPEEPLTGTYTMESGWALDDAESTSEKSVYKQEALLDQTETSTITCSYIDTNYSVMEYELLRDMLTNNLFYSNVNAQISTSAVYTDNKDYLYILIADDSSQGYRNIYHYVVGDYRCFLVEVKEYRAEAEQAKSQEGKTPQEVGQTVAEEFVWNTQW